MPFIEYAETFSGPNKQERQVVFINVDYVAKAIYGEQGLSLTIAIPSVDDKFSVVTLKGTEAENAMKALRQAR